MLRSALLFLSVFLTVNFAGALDIVSHYSPRNKERPVRGRTDYIVLHTTEAAAKGSLNKIHARGEAHYFVDTNGRTYRIIDKNRVAFHAGRSMWNGKTDIDNYSIGIEVVGYHNKDMTSAQYRALRELIAELKRVYKIKDDRVLTHSMVAYGSPNRWQKKSHRGRKRCGMLFAKADVREKLGLRSKPSHDPDVRAGRLVNADPYLASVLYGGIAEQEKASGHFRGSDANVISSTRSAWDIAREKYNSSDTVYVFPDGTKLRGDQIKDWRKVPAGTRLLLQDGLRDNEFEGIKTLGVDGASVKEIAGDEYRSSATVYITPDGSIRVGNEIKDSEWGVMPEKTRILVGYIRGGQLTAKKTAYEICGKYWNFPSTYYMLPGGDIIAGDMIKECSVPAGTHVFYRR